MELAFVVCFSQCIGKMSNYFWTFSLFQAEKRKSEKVDIAVYNLNEKSAMIQKVQKSYKSKGKSVSPHVRHVLYQLYSTVTVCETMYFSNTSILAARVLCSHTKKICYILYLLTFSLVRLSINFLHLNTFSRHCRTRLLVICRLLVSFHSFFQFFTL